VLLAEEILGFGRGFNVQSAMEDSVVGADVQQLDLVDAQHVVVNGLQPK